MKNESPRKRGRPKSDERMIPLLLSVPPTMLALVDEFAAKDFSTRADEMRRLIVDGIRARVKAMPSLEQVFAESRRKVFGKKGATHGPR